MPLQLKNISQTLFMFCVCVCGWEGVGVWVCVGGSVWVRMGVYVFVNVCVDNQGHKVWFKGSFSLTTFMQLEFKNTY